MSITVLHHKGMRFSAHYDDHQVTIDLPEDRGGSDRGT